jgi:Bacterial TSP3 repeat
MAETTNNLTQNQKLALVGLTFFGVLLIGIWIYKFNNEIRTPLLFNSSVSNTASTTALAAEEKSKSLDTDGDGLSDWDELNVYHTSPYLADSDSDGIPDGTEIKNGTDPNCPEGKDCGAAALPVPAANTASTTPTQNISGSTPVASSSTEDAAAIREVLLQDKVMSQADLDKISDADLLKFYQQLLASSSGQ